MADTMLPSGISVRIREDLIDGASRVQTTLIVDPMITDGGHRMLMADMGTIAYGKIDGGTNREEIVSWTGITDNTNTYTLTGCVWGINFHNTSADVDNTRRHTSGAKFEIKTDMHYITNQFRDNLDNVFTATDDMDFTADNIKLGDGTTDSDKILYAQNGDANKPFMSYDESEDKWLISNNGVDTYDPSSGGSGLTAGDGIDIVASAINVDLTELTTDTALDTTANQLSVVVYEDTGLYVDANGIGIESDLVTNRSLFPVYTEDAVMDGTNTFTWAGLVGSTYTLTEDITLRTLTIDASIILETAGYKIYCGALTNNGTIQNNATNGGDASGVTAGSAGTGAVGGKDGKIGAAGQSTGNTSGNAGIAGETETYILASIGTAGGGGGTGGSFNTGGGAAGAAGAGTLDDLTANDNYSFPVTLTAGTEDTNEKSFVLETAQNGTTFLSSSGSGSGGSGGSWGSGGVSGGGGGSGGTGGRIYIKARTLTNNGAITANGGNGGSAGTSTVASGGSGGGAGGSGGVIILVYVTLTAGTLSVAGGTGGTASANGPSGGTAGTNGVDGLAGKIYKLNL